MKVKMKILTRKIHPGQRVLNQTFRKAVLFLLCLLLIFMAPVGLAQAPSAVSIYSIWIRLSLRGLNQEEIESVLNNMDPKAIEEVKGRLRHTVLSNLEAKQIRHRFQTSRDTDDLKSVRRAIETELRFAGMQSDPELKLLIKDRFGISMNRL